MNAITGQPTKRVTIPVDLLAELVLPVGKDDSGQLVASNGFIWQRFLDYATLEALGIRVVWRDADNQPIDRDTAVALIERQRAQAEQASASQAANEDVA